jgi:hypothetical protein
MHGFSYELSFSFTDVVLSIIISMNKTKYAYTLNFDYVTLNEANLVR